ncbi:uncharacterized protein LOC127461544 isoform X1 [Manacus candei]|uniref:uncharacterized protein LOC127461544 isoform X1 n=1 Tax=Manacus candei TaxID=415023 RepID=UPI002225E4D9|nr:uncharacterized protein LOC127461544 isoform X1 [Manacus candei]
MRCKCIKSTAQVINLGLILTIDVTPPGLHCRRKEIILTLKKNKRVCVAPEAPWIQLLVHRLTQRYAGQSGISNALAGRCLPPHLFRLSVSSLPPTTQECRQEGSGGAAAAGGSAGAAVPFPSRLPRSGPAAVPIRASPEALNSRWDGSDTTAPR